MKFYYITNIVDIHTSANETTALLKFFQISTEMHFVSLFFVSERNTATLLLMVHLKCTVAHYANLNSRPINKPYLRAVEYAIFFNFSFTFILTRLLSKTLWKKLSFFNINFQNSFQDVVYYRILGCQTLWY